ncbi:MAG: alpha/beta fold hydrolase [Solirubrobacteraceae bacterium]
MRSYPVELPILAQQLPEIDTLVQIIAGRRDRAVALANAEFLDERLPNSTLVIIEAGHFMWEEAAGEYGSIIADWVTGGYRAAS